MKLPSFIQLHISVFLFGFTAILGDLIQLPLVSLIWWRVFLSIIATLFLIKPLSLIRNISALFFWRHVFIGALVSIHWLAFYGSIKISNASIVLIAMSTTSFATALLEPLIIRKSKWRSFDLIISILVIPPMVLIYYNANSVQQLGLWVGLFASVVGALFSILNKLWINEGEELKIVFIQQGSVWFFLSIPLIIATLIGKDIFVVPQGIDWFYMLIFALVCTVFAYYLYLKSMHKLSAFDVSFAFNMEPVYGIIMAAAILFDHKELSPRIYLGMGLILMLVVAHTFLKSRTKPG